MNPQIKASLLRFAKGLIAGSIGAGVLAVQALGPAAALTDWKYVTFAFVNGCLTGAIMAAEKFLMWQPDQTTVTTAPSTTVTQ
jgi:hypothetical protein